MFRKPRDQASSTVNKPSMGRPPTPPLRSKTTCSSLSSTTTIEKMATVRQKPPNKSQTTLANSFAKAQVRRKGKTNGNILNFFKKVDDGEKSLFLDNPTPIKHDDNPSEDLTTSFVRQDHDIGHDASRFNEDGNAMKRRRLDSDTPTTDESKTQKAAFHSVEGNRGESNTLDKENDGARESRRASGGPFIEDSDSEDDKPLQGITTTDDVSTKTEATDLAESLSKDSKQDVTGVEAPTVPSLKREPTSFVYNDLDEFEAFGDIAEEFPEEGEEYMERRWMEEQRRLELEFERDGDTIEGNERETDIDGTKPDSIGQDAEPSCPICGISFQTKSSQVRGHPIRDQHNLMYGRKRQFMLMIALMANQPRRRAVIPRPLLLLYKPALHLSDFNVPRLQGRGNPTRLLRTRPPVDLPLSPKSCHPMLRILRGHKPPPTKSHQEGNLHSRERVLSTRYYRDSQSAWTPSATVPLRDAKPTSSVTSIATITSA